MSRLIPYFKMAKQPKTMVTKVVAILMGSGTACEFQMSSKAHATISNLKCDLHLIIYIAVCLTQIISVDKGLHQVVRSCQNGSGCITKGWVAIDGSCVTFVGVPQV